MATGRLPTAAPLARLQLSRHPPRRRTRRYPRRASPCAPSARIGSCCLLALALVVAALLLPNPQLAALRELRATEAAIAEQVATLEALQEEILQNEALTAGAAAGAAGAADRRAGGAGAERI